jgi:hypothetical protein
MEAQLPPANVAHSRDLSLLSVFLLEPIGRFDVGYCETAADVRVRLETGEGVGNLKWDAYFMLCNETWRLLTDKLNESHFSPRIYQIVLVSSKTIGVMVGPMNSAGLEDILPK